MEFPLVFAKDLTIHEPRQTATEVMVGSQRVQATFQYTAECRLSTKEEKFIGPLVRDRAIELCQIRVLRRFYPLEIGKAIHDLRCELVHDPRIQRDAAQYYLERLAELHDALQPGAR